MNTLTLKIRKQEFFSVYGISILLKKAGESDREYLVDYLRPIVEKYLTITEYAIRSELRHVVTNGIADIVQDAIHNPPPNTSDFKSYERWTYAHAKKEVLATFGIREWNYNVRRTITMEKAAYLFDALDWDSDFGGEAWARITTGAIELREKLPVTRENLEKVISAIDRLNDLEHNNALYLAAHCTFFLHRALNKKADRRTSETEIIKECPKELQHMYRDYQRERVFE